MNTPHHDAIADLQRKFEDLQCRVTAIEEARAAEAKAAEACLREFNEEFKGLWDEQDNETA